MKKCDLGMVGGGGVGGGVGCSACALGVCVLEEEGRVWKAEQPAPCSACYQIMCSSIFAKWVPIKISM